MKPGWLKRQTQLAKKDFEMWPEWMKREAMKNPLLSENKMTKLQRAKQLAKENSTNDEIRLLVLTLLEICEDQQLEIEALKNPKYFAKGWGDCV